MEVKELKQHMAHAKGVQMSALNRWEKDGCFDSKEEGRIKTKQLHRSTVDDNAIFNLLFWIDKVDFLWVIFIHTHETRSKLLH